MRHRASMLVEVLVMLPVVLVVVYSITALLIMSDKVTIKYAADLEIEKARNEIITELSGVTRPQQINRNTALYTVKRINRTKNSAKIFILHKGHAAGRESTVVWPKTND